MTKAKATREDLEAFETAYNAGCVCIARGELGQAEFLLKRARGKIMGLAGAECDRSWANRSLRCFRRVHGGAKA